MARETYVWRDGKVIPKSEAPPLRKSGLQIIRDIEPYRNAVDGGIVGGRKQHRDFLRAHSLTEVGDQAPTEPPKPPPDRIDVGLAETIKRSMGKL